MISCQQRIISIISIQQKVSDSLTVSHFNYMDLPKRKENSVSYILVRKNIFGNDVWRITTCSHVLICTHQAPADKHLYNAYPGKKTTKVSTQTDLWLMLFTKELKCKIYRKPNMKWRESVFWEDKEPSQVRKRGQPNFILCNKCTACQEGSCYSCPHISVFLWLVDEI